MYIDNRSHEEREDRLSFLSNVILIISSIQEKTRSLRKISGFSVKQRKFIVNIRKRIYPVRSGSFHLAFKRLFSVFLKVITTQLLNFSSIRRETKKKEKENSHSITLHRINYALHCIK